MTTDSLEPQYKLLGALKQIDDRIYRIRVDLERIPEQIETLTTELKAKELVLKNTTSLFDEKKKQLRAAELELNEKEESLKKAESKMMEVKTNEAYHAALKENQAQRDAKNLLEERALELMSQIETQRTEAKGLEDNFQVEQEATNTQVRSLNETLGQLKLALTRELEARAKHSAELNPDIRDLYLNICKHSSGQTIVYAEDGMCLGCNINIRPQSYNDLLGYRAVHRCQNCGRLLILSQRASAANAEQQDENR